MHTTVYEKSPKFRMRPSRRFGAAHQVFVVVKLSDNLSLFR